jgi:hypothetical protein
MAVTNFTPLLGLALPTTGDLSGTWGTTVNDAITDLLDDAVAGTVTLSADADVTLTTTNGADNQARNAVILCTGARTGIKTITAPAQSKAYIIINATSGGFGVKIVGAGPSTPGVTVPNGEKTLVAWNGSDFVQITSSVIDLTSEVTGTLPIANGGTGTTSTTFANLTTNVTGTLPIANGGTGTTSTTFANLTTNVTGTLPVANGGTGITSLGAGVATFLGTPSSANLASAVTDETGTGALVFATSPTLVTPLLGTPTSGVLSSCTVDGTNLVGYKAIPQSGSAKTTSYTLATGDIGEFIEVGASGSIVVPNSTFAAGDAVVIFNNTSGAITLTMSITTAYIGGTDADKATISLATRGVCNVLFISGTVCVVTGNVS